MWENRDAFTALAVLPYNGGSYIQAPFEDISREEYMRLVGNLHEINLDKIIERDDNTTLSDQAACAGPGGCEIT